MAAGSLFRFDDDNNMKYTYSHNYHKMNKMEKNGKNTAPYIAYNDERIAKIDLDLDTLNRIYLSYVRMYTQI